MKYKDKHWVARFCLWLRYKPIWFILFFKTLFLWVILRGAQSYPDAELHTRKDVISFMWRYHSAISSQLMGDTYTIDEILGEMEIKKNEDA